MEPARSASDSEDFQVVRISYRAEALRATSPVGMYEACWCPLLGSSGFAAGADGDVARRRHG